MEIEGKIILDLPQEGGTSARTGNPWKKKGWVLETFGQYPRKVKFDVFGDRVDSLRFEPGKSYRVSVDAESREYNGRWYTDLRAYAMQEMGESNMAPAGGYQQPAAPQPAAPADPFSSAAGPVAPADPFASGNETDDLPF